MIKTKADLKHYLSEDRKFFSTKPTWKDRILKTEKYYSWTFITALRKTEYRMNNRSGLLSNLLFQVQYIIFMRLMHKTGLYLFPNVFGPGLYIPHVGYMLVSAQAEIGSNCVVRPGLLIASNLGTNNTKLRKVIIGDNVEFSAGCKILCKRIGNNVSVGPNAVVTRNVPDNSTVMGNPGEIIPKPVINNQ